MKAETAITKIKMTVNDTIIGIQLVDIFGTDGLVVIMVVGGGIVFICTPGATAANILPSDNDTLIRPVASILCSDTMAAALVGSEDCEPLRSAIVRLTIRLPHVILHIVIRLLLIFN